MNRCTVHGLFLLMAAVCYANNPVIQTIFTADPAPMVHEGTLYLYTGHDDDNAPDNKYTMHDYRCYSSTDMVNWTDQGAVLNIREVFDWSGGDANAAQCIYRNGKFYYYISTSNAKGPGGIALGVAVSDSPTGPFKDAIGRALVTNDQTTYGRHSWDDLDPTVFIDDDGRAFLYWGNNACYYAELNEDMISLKSEISFLPLNREIFGPDFEEAPWTYKRSNIYYLVYASGLPESICYATSNSPTGPWSYGGLIMSKPLQQGLITNHPGVIDYKGNSYLFYHTAALPNGGDKRRCVCVEQFEYNSDGSFPKIEYSNEGIVKGVATLNPFTKTQAETMAWASGVETAKDANTGMYVTDISSGDYIKVRDVNFAKKPSSFKAVVASAANSGSIEIHLDSADGDLVGTCAVVASGDTANWITSYCLVKEVSGVHDLYFKFVGSGDKLFNFDSWQFN